MGRLVIADRSVASSSNSLYDSIASSGKRNKGSSDKKQQPMRHASPLEQKIKQTHIV
jgi:hypothetical protein